MFYRKQADNPLTTNYIMKLASEGVGTLKPKWTHEALAQFLNTKGYVTSQGNRWTRSSLTYFLNNQDVYRNGRASKVII